MANKNLLLRAARAIEEEAKLQRESCQIAKPNWRPLEWACSDCNVATCPTKKRYEQLLQLAKDLRAGSRANG